ncbi:MAG: PEGA domain-containing protein, partial [Deltaproteobacteria bacterium]
ELVPGSHRVRVEKEGYEGSEREVMVKASERAEVSVSLKRMMGGLLIQTEPAGANVYIDGRSVGVSPYEARDLSPGPHRVRIVKQGYDVWEREVVVEAGKKGEIRSQLVKFEVPKPSEPPSGKVTLPKPEKPLKEKWEAPNWNVNDSWVYVNQEGKTWEIKVERIEKELFIANSSLDQSLMGIDRNTLETKVYVTSKGKRPKDTEMGDFLFKFPLELSRKWSKMITAVPTTSHVPSNFLNEYRVVAYEDVTVRAGTFKAFKIELKQDLVSGIYAATGGSKKAHIWYCPEIKKEIKVLYEGDYWGSKAKSFELTSYKVN